MFESTNVGSSVSYFIVITLVYIIFKISIITNSKNYYDLNNKENTTYLISYILLILIGNYILNNQLIKQTCNSSTIDWFSVFYITFIPWLFIFGTLYAILILFDNWLKPFSNTIGYFIVKLLGAKDIINNIISDVNDLDTKDDKHLIAQAIINVKQNPMKIINEMSSDISEFLRFIKELSTANIIKKELKGKIDNISQEGDEKNEILELLKLINIKDEIGKLVWFILSGLLISTITYNHIINIECSKSLSDIKKEYNEYIEDE